MHQNFIDIDDGGDTGWGFTLPKKPLSYIPR